MKGGELAYGRTIWMALYQRMVGWVLGRKERGRMVWK